MEDSPNDFRKGRSGNPAKIGRTHALPQRKLLQRPDWQPYSTRIRRSLLGVQIIV